VWSVDKEILSFIALDQEIIAANICA
jgi:hypothetical protein